MLIFVSDLHLRPGASPHLSRAAQFERFWLRIDQSRQGDAAQLCFVGDLVDLVRAPDWHRGALRPYHEPGPEVAAAVTDLVRETIAAEKPFFAAIRAKVAAGALAVDYVVGNHDRLMHHAPAARALLREALGMRGGEAPFPTEARFPKYGVLAYHGHVVDQLCHDPEGAPPLSDMIASELIVRFPQEIRRRLQLTHARLDDIDDVRPIVAVPAWVRQLSAGQGKGVGLEIGKAWSELVEQFLDNGAVRDWFKGHHRKLSLDFAGKVKLLLTLSTKRGLRADSALHVLNDTLFRLLDVRFAKAALRELDKAENRPLRYVVNGHTHFANMTPLGLVDGKPACYFNIGTWRPVHQLGNIARRTPGFLAYDAMSYLVFFGDGDPMGREFEWWQGAAASRA